MKKIILSMLSLWIAGTVTAQKVIRVSADEGNMTQKIQTAIDEAVQCKDKKCVIELRNADYHIYRNSASAVLYHVSNTASEEENPDQTKHIALWIKGAENLTIDGKGARLITHGEMTSFVIDACRNVTLRNLTITAADPTVPECTVETAGDDYMIVQVHPTSHYSIENDKLTFTGEGWSLSGGIAQAYDREKDMTWRCRSPFDGLTGAIELDKNRLRLVYDKAPETVAGQVFQMRDAIRDEVCGLIQESKDVLIENVHFAFLGNFGIVGQMSENITYRHLTFEPEVGSGRTCAGFADFVQMSGCKGKIMIENSRFVGAHDDPINIHGTHLAVMRYITDRQLIVRYMHPQTYGFAPFHSGNEIEWVDAHSLKSCFSAEVKTVETKNEREYLLTIDRVIPIEVREKKEMVVENVTYTPEVIIRNNYFARIPTRGVLVTTRRKVQIENNTFFRMMMSGILIADDARSWYESGPVYDVTLSGNRFIECGSPVIAVMPENDVFDGFVHRNITIENNRFYLRSGEIVSARAVDGLRVIDNTISSSSPLNIQEIVRTRDCKNVTIRNNKIELQNIP